MLNAIKKARLIAGVTQSELANTLGVSTGAISQWEQGRTKPNIRRLKKIATVLNTTVENLLDDEERAI